MLALENSISNRENKSLHEEKKLGMSVISRLMPEDKFKLLYDEVLDDANYIPHLTDSLHEIPVAETLMRLANLLKNIFGPHFLVAKKFYHETALHRLDAAQHEIVRVGVVYGFLYETFMLSVKDKDLDLLTCSDDDRASFHLTHAHYHYHHSLLNLLELVINDDEWINKKKIEKYWK